MIDFRELRPQVLYGHLTDFRFNPITGQTVRDEVNMKTGVARTIEVSSGKVLVELPPPWQPLTVPASVMNADAAECNFSSSQLRGKV
jgi:hypothetical protein